MSNHMPWLMIPTNTLFRSTSKLFLIIGKEVSLPCKRAFNFWNINLSIHILRSKMVMFPNNSGKL